MALLILLVPIVALADAAIPFHEKGKVVKKSVSAGVFYQYIPNSANRHSRVLIVAHGSLSKKHNAFALAEKFLRRWMLTAEKARFIIAAPAFTERDYQSYGGYRGLFGRDFGADEFVQQIVTKYTPGKRFYLYGHSAGAQFAIRYSIRHANTLKAVVASAPGRYAFPDRSAPWPYGMAALKRTIVYKNPHKKQEVLVRPAPQDWLEATSANVTILVGQLDVDPQPKRPGHIGRTRIELAVNWAAQMNKLAKRDGRRSRIRVEVIPGIGHNSRKLTPHASKILLRSLQK